MLRRGFAIFALAVVSVLAAPVPGSAQGSDCAREAASMHRAESQLPRLEVAPPNDRQIMCITLETNILFARRLAAHLKHCPRSPLARSGEHWEHANQDLSAQFRNRRCKPAIRSYRG